MSTPALDLWGHQEPYFGTPEDEAAAFRARIEQIALELAARAAECGLTAADIRLTAERRGVHPPHESAQRAWSCLAGILGALVKAGRLVPTGRWRPSPIPKSHGNRHQVYCAPSWREEPR